MCVVVIGNALLFVFSFFLSSGEKKKKGITYKFFLPEKADDENFSSLCMSAFFSFLVLAKI